MFRVTAVSIRGCGSHHLAYSGVIGAEFHSTKTSKVERFAFTLFQQMALLIIGLLLLIFVIWYFSPVRTRNYPPGPQGLPFVGNLLQLGNDLPVQYSEWSEQFGKIFSVRQGMVKMVIINDFEAARRTFSDEVATGRDPNDMQRVFMGGKGITQAEGELWREHRRFALATLRDLGMGKSWMEDKILEEAVELRKWIDQYNGSPINIRTNLVLSVSNVVCALVFGRRYDHNDQVFKDLSALISKNLNSRTRLTLIKLYPFLRYLPFGSLKNHYDAWRSSGEGLQDFMLSQIKEHEADRASWTEGVPDYVNSFMEEKAKKESKNEQASTFTLPQLGFSVQNLYSAGTETTATTLLWAFVYVFENPEVMRKAQEEIDSVVTSGELVRVSHRSSLKYTEATLLEIQRLGSVLPLGVAHTNFEDITIDRYVIPKRTVMITNTFHIHRDPELFPEPLTFKPERYFDAKGNLFIPPGFMPFGIGKRSCLGENLAKMELFLYFANIIHEYNLQTGDDPKMFPSSERYKVTLTRLPDAFEMRFVRR